MIRKRGLRARFKEQRILERLHLQKRSIMTFEEFVEKFSNLKPGQSFIYHKGDLAIDRNVDPVVEKIARKALQLGTKRLEAIDASITYRRYDYQKPRAEEWGLGTASLTQRRKALHLYEYIITKKA